MAVKATILCITALLLNVCLEVKIIDGHFCTPNLLVDCETSSKLNITKSRNYYYMRLPVCSNDECDDLLMILDGIQLIDCDSICEDCYRLTGQGQ